MRTRPRARLLLAALWAALLLSGAVRAQDAPASGLDAYRAASAAVELEPWLKLQLGDYDWVAIARDGALERLGPGTPRATLEAALRDLVRFHEVNRLSDPLVEARDPHHVRRMAWFVEDEARRLRNLVAGAIAAEGGPADPLSDLRRLDGKLDVHRLIGKKFLLRPEAARLPRRALEELQRTVIMTLGSTVVPHAELARLNERIAELLYRPRFEVEALVGKSEAELRALVAEHQVTGVPAAADRVELLRHLSGRSPAEVRAILGLPEPAPRPRVVVGTVEELAGRRASELLVLARQHGVEVPEAMRDTGEIIRLLAGEERTSIFAVKRRIVAAIEARERAEREARRAGFAGPRRAGTPAAGEFPAEAAAEVFAAVKEAALRGVEARLDALPPADSPERHRLERGLLELGGLRLEVVDRPEVLAEVRGGTVRVSTGLLAELDARGRHLPAAERAAFRARALGLILGHEAAHAAGTVDERAADREAVRTLERSTLGPVGEAEIRATVDAFDRPTGSRWLDVQMQRLRDLLRYGTPAGRSRALESAARGEADPLAAYRRADGTVEWGRVTRDRALREAGGLAHFGLALFLKELAVVAGTGDRARIEEFFDGLMTTDFYRHYGMFVLGARAGEVAYARYLERYVRPRFVNGVLRTNLVLAAGLALPQLVEGTFEGKAFAISLGSLGLSSAAVKAGVRSISWVYDLARARRTGTLARLGLGASRFARAGGWFYTAAELAVVLYVAEEVEEQVHGYLDARAARAALADAGEALLAAARDPAADAAAAVERYHAAWIDYRNFLYRPLQQDEALFASRLERAARQAKLAADEREAALSRLRAHPALARSVASRYGSLDAYAAALASETDAALDRDVNGYLESYQRAREGHLREVYEEGRRRGDYLAGLEHRGWLLGGAAAGAPGDPYGARRDPFAELGRARLRAGLRDALERPSGNRLQAYDDEAEVLAATAGLLRAGGRTDAAARLEALRGTVLRTRELDRGLIAGDGLITVSPAPPLGERSGVTDRLEALTPR